MINYDYLLENSDIDLLDIIEFSNLENEVINEATIAGMKITKEKLEDEEYVKELVKKIRENKHTSVDVGKALFIIGAISTITIIGAPIGLLLLAISSLFKSDWELNERDLKKLDDCFDKTINKLTDKKNKTKDKSKKDELEKIIKDLENNRERIYERKAKAATEDKVNKLVDVSKYGDFGIKVGGIEIICQFNDNAGNPVGYANKFNSEKELQDQFKTSKFPFNMIEQFYVNGIKTQEDLIKLCKSKGTIRNGLALMGGSEDHYGPTVNKYLNNKQVIEILTDVHDTCVIYSFDDKCCYYWYIEDMDDIVKLSVNDFLKASKTAYEDLVKIYKEFK